MNTKKIIIIQPNDFFKYLDIVKKSNMFNKSRSQLEGTKLRSFKDIINLTFGYNFYNKIIGRIHHLRGLYAHMANKLYNKTNEEPIFFMKNYLGHGSTDSTFHYNLYNDISSKEN